MSPVHLFRLAGMSMGRVIARAHISSSLLAQMALPPMSTSQYRKRVALADMDPIYVWPFPSLKEYLGERMK